jgi:tricorn protease
MAWKPDSSAVVFRSGRKTVHREQHLYEVPVAGGLETQIKVGMGSLASFSPDGGKLAFESIPGEPDGSPGTAIWMIDTP